MHFGKTSKTTRKVANIRVLISLFEDTKDGETLKADLEYMSEMNVTACF